MHSTILFLTSIIALLWKFLAAKVFVACGAKYASIQLLNRDLRENFKVAVKTIAMNNNIKEEDVNLDELTQGFVRSEATLQPNSQVLIWPIVDTQNIAGSPTTPTMQLLPEQDSFIVGSLGYWMMVYSYTNGNQANPDFTTGNNWIPVTYPSAWDENGSSPSWSPGTTMLWMGYISIEVNKKVLIPYWDCMRHFLSPRTQAANGNTSPTWSGYGQKDGFDGGTDAFYPVEPLIMIGGGRQNLIKLNLPTNIPSTIAPFSNTGVGYGTSFVAKAVLCFRGIWAQNSTSVR